MRHIGPRLLAGPSVLDRKYFERDFDSMLIEVRQVVSQLEGLGTDCELTDEFIAAARAAHASGEIQQVFEVYWIIYDGERAAGTIPVPGTGTKEYWYD